MRAIALLAMVMMTLVPGGAEARTETRSYVGSPGPYTYLTLCNPNVGAVCFETEGANAVNVRITDRTGLPVAGYVVFHGVEWTWDYAGPVCGARSSIGIPSSATRMTVYIAGPVETPLWCPDFLGGSVGGVAGTVRATFRS